MQASAAAVVAATSVSSYSLSKFTKWQSVLQFFCCCVKEEAKQFSATSALRELQRRRRHGKRGRERKRETEERKRGKTRREGRRRKEEGKKWKSVTR